jgi:hypothetical protein
MHILGYLISLVVGFAAGYLCRRKNPTDPKYHA